MTFNDTTAPDTVHCWVDGSCLGNPGPGGYAGIKVLNGKKAKPILGFCATRTTNNEMELTAVLEMLRSLKRPDLPAVIYSDSQYAVLALTQWLARWRANGWLNSDGQPVANRQLIEDIAEMAEARPATAPIILRHIPRAQNSEADRLARAQAELAKLTAPERRAN